MTSDASVLGSLHSVDGEGVVRIHVEHLADYISGRELRVDGRALRSVRSTGRQLAQ